MSLSSRRRYSRGRAGDSVCAPITMSQRPVNRVFGVICGVLLGVALAGCEPSRYGSARDIYRSAAPVTHGFHQVKAGDTLYSIAWRYNRDYEELARLNGIPAPYRIYSGQTLKLGKSRYQEPAERYVAQRPEVKQPPLKPAPGYKKPKNHSKPIQEKVAKIPPKPVSMSWRWPASGQVIRSYSLQGEINKGIDLAGNRGEPVFAAADGEVVYSGTGLVGYGNLIILKHNEAFLSAYAHNSQLLVKEGDFAKAGQKIAEIGSSGANRDQLHFEIRRNGKPVNPMQYLPKR